MSRRMLRGRGKQVRMRLIAPVSMVLAGAAVVTGGLWIGGTFSSSSEEGQGSIQPADDEASPTQPTPSETPNALGPARVKGIFAGVGGWIAFGDRRGIWAVDPTRPDAADSLVQLSSEEGIPTSWSPDGSKLIVQRATKGPDLFVLNSDGSETPLTHADFRSGAEFTPDGSQVIYAAALQDDGGDSNIYAIDAEGGTPKLLLTETGGSLYDPALSPDGSQIAYFHGWGDSSHSLRVMSSDGTGTRVVVENEKTMGIGHVTGLDWSPDGQHLLFALDSMGVYVVGIDGSGLTQVSSETSQEVNPHWSPDGSLISYSSGDALVIARPDGTQVLELHHRLSGPWNPR